MVKASLNTSALMQETIANTSDEGKDATASLPTWRIVVLNCYTSEVVIRRLSPEIESVPQGHLPQDGGQCFPSHMHASIKSVRVKQV